MPKPVGNRFHHHTLDSDVWEMLREEPVTSREMEMPQGGPLRSMIGKIEYNTGHAGAGEAFNCERWISVYYLYGDERRAVRKYIEENTDFVRENMKRARGGGGTSVMKIHSHDTTWQMFVEEWEYMVRHGEVEGCD